MGKRRLAEEGLTTTASSFVPNCRHGVLGSALVEPGGMASTRGAVRRTLGPRTLQTSWQMQMNLSGQPSTRHTQPTMRQSVVGAPPRTPSCGVQCGQEYRQTGLSELRLQAVRARCSPRRTAGTAGSEDTRWVGNTRRVARAGATAQQHMKRCFVMHTGTLQYVCQAGVEGEPPALRTERQ